MRRILLHIGQWLFVLAVGVRIFLTEPSPNVSADTVPPPVRGASRRLFPALVQPPSQDVPRAQPSVPEQVKETPEQDRMTPMQDTVTLEQDKGSCTAEPQCPAYDGGTIGQGDGVALGTLPKLLLVGTRKVLHCPLPARVATGRPIPIFCIGRDDYP